MTSSNLSRTKHDKRVPLFLFAIILLTPIISTPVIAKQAQDDSARELSGMSASAAFVTKDDLPLDLEAPTALSMLYRLRNASPTTLEEFTFFTRNTTLSEARDETIDYRFWLFQLPATLNKVERIPIADAPDTSDTIRHFYRCSAQTTDEAGNPVHCTILSRTVPSQLLDQTEINTPIEFTGLLYCRATLEAPDQTAPLKTIVFIADSLAWFPKNEGLADKRMIRLAAKGFDVSQLDLIKSCNGKPLGSRDSEAFFQMLSTVNADPTSPGTNSPAVPIKSIIAKSTQNIGARVTIQARCRDCTKVPVIDPDKRERYGIDHLYQLILFPDLKQSIVLNETTKDGPVKAVYERFPITVCCTELPAGMSVDDIEGNTLLIDGTFFRVWKYDAEINKKANTSGTISPLIIAGEPEVIATSMWLSQLFSWVFGIVAVGLAFMYAYHRIFGSKQPRPTESILDNLPEKLDLTGIE